MTSAERLLILAEAMPAQTVDLSTLRNLETVARQRIKSKAIDSALHRLAQAWERLEAELRQELSPAGK